MMDGEQQHQQQPQQPPQQQQQRRILNPATGSSFEPAAVIGYAVDLNSALRSAYLNGGRQNDFGLFMRPYMVPSQSDAMQGSMSHGVRGISQYSTPLLPTTHPIYVQVTTHAQQFGTPILQRVAQIDSFIQPQNAHSHASLSHGSNPRIGNYVPCTMHLMHGQQYGLPVYTNYTFGASAYLTNASLFPSNYPAYIPEPQAQQIMQGVMSQRGGQPGFGQTVAASQTHPAETRVTFSHVMNSWDENHTARAVPLSEECNCSGIPLNCTFGHSLESTNYSSVPSMCSSNARPQCAGHVARTSCSSNGRSNFFLGYGYRPLQVQPMLRDLSGEQRAEQPIVGQMNSSWSSTHNGSTSWSATRNVILSGSARRLLGRPPARDIASGRWNSNDSGVRRTNTDEASFRRSLSQNTSISPLVRTRRNGTHSVYGRRETANSNGSFIRIELNNHRDATSERGVQLAQFRFAERRQNIVEFIESPEWPETGDLLQELFSPGGLDLDAIAELPTFRANDLSILSDVRCVICLSNYVSGELLRRLIPCMHYYHRGCIDRWLQCNSTCPTCRCYVNPSALLVNDNSTNPLANDEPDDIVSASNMSQNTEGRQESRCATSENNASGDRQRQSTLDLFNGITDFSSISDDSENGEQNV